MAHPGRLVLVVGPSGAGKDSLLRAAAGSLAEDRRFVFPRRVITRPSHDDTEAHDSLTVAAFLTAQAAGRFALSWQAHGLHYGIPAAIIADLEAGRTVVVNVSRAIIADTVQRFAHAAILEVTAPAEIIAGRLARRGRETPADIAARLARATAPLEGAGESLTIVNDSTLEAALRAFIAALRHFSEGSYAKAV